VSVPAAAGGNGSIKGTRVFMMLRHPILATFLKEALPFPQFWGEIWRPAKTLRNTAPFKNILL
jgi:hypothetical protein